jgi:hypothetical protein
MTKPSIVKPRNPTPQQLAAMRLYQGLMEEVKTRFAAIEHAVNNRTGLGPRFVYEFGYLQLRYLCELVALGCLVAHGDITETNKLRKEYSATRIMQSLSALHPDFYPVPHRKVDMPPGTIPAFRLEAIDSDFRARTNSSSSLESAALSYIEER